MSPVAAVAFVLAVVVAFLIYRPDHKLPFDDLDFSEFLPILQSTDSYWERSWRLIRYYASHGRANVLPYALLSAKWELFGWWSPGWQWSRFAVMVGILVLSFQLLRRLGATVMAALAGSSLFLSAPAAAVGWIRLTMGEPLGTLMLLALCLTIVPARRLPGNHWRWVRVCLLTAGMLLTKEMFAAALLLPLGLLILTDEDGQLRAPAASRQAIQLLVVFAAVGLLCLGPMFVVAVRAPAQAFSSMYGTAMRGIPQILTHGVSTFVPVDMMYGLPRPAMGVALVLFAGLIAGGWWFFLRIDERSSHRAWLLVLAVSFPLVGAIVYAPWPAYQLFYAIPFLAGAAILVAFALTGFERRTARPVQIAAYGWWGVLLLVSVVWAHWQAGIAAASQLATYRLVTRVSSLPGIDSVLVATDHIPPQEWQGPASTLQRYATAMNVPWPPARDIPCPSGSSLGSVSHGNAAVVYKSDLCPRRGSEAIVERFQRVSLGRFRLITDSVRIDVERLPSVR